jgi:chloride channel protein, CIC family
MTMSSNGPMLAPAAMTHDNPAEARPGVTPSEALNLVVIIAVSAAAAAFAHFMRGGILWCAHLLGKSRDPTVAAASLSPLLRFVVVFAGLFAAGALGRWARRRHGDSVGISAVAAAARGSGPGPEVNDALIRASGTFVASAALASVGREAAIMETGGAIGYRAGRYFGLNASGVAAAGIGAAFAAAYHAPVSAVLYVEEHLGVRRRPRAAIATAVGAIVGHLITIRVFGGRTLFSATTGRRRDLLVLGSIALVPTVLVSRAFLVMRHRLMHWRPGGQRVRYGQRYGLAALAALTVAIVPRAAGNGMEAIRHTAGGASIAVILALAVGKLVATSATLGSGVPGGAFSPSMAVSAGWALLTFELLSRAGVAVPGDRWGGVLIAMAIGIAVGVEAPMVGAVIVAEMTGDVGLLPFTALFVGVAFLLNRGLTRVIEGRPQPHGRGSEPHHTHEDG